MEVAAQSTGFAHKQLRLALDSRPLWGAGRVEHTLNLLGHALRKGVSVIARHQSREVGVFADGSSWSKVIPALQDHGYHVVAAQIPLTSIADDIAVVRRVLAAQSAPVVLVGHSYGGVVISGAATGAENVKALVFIAAYAPDEGENLLDLNGKFPPTDGPNHLVFDVGGFATVDQAAFPAAFAADVDLVEARVMAAIQKPAAGGNFAEKAGVPAWRTLPSWYLVSQNDQMISPDLERWLAARMGATVREIGSSHASAVSHPEAVIDLVDAAAQTVSA